MSAKRILGTTIALGDVTDVENFIQNSITRSRVKLTNDERHELVAEGFAIMLELWHKYDPNKDRGGNARNDGSTAGVASFAGFASFLLGRKLGDAWHKMNAHHVMRTNADGIKAWHYLPTNLSYNQLTTTRPGDDRDTTIREDRMRTIGDFIRP